MIPLTQTKGNKMFTHKIKSSNQLCRIAPWWPTTDRDYINNDKSWPLMVLASGQITKVRSDKLTRLK